MTKTVCIFAGARGKDHLFPDCALIAKALSLSGWDVWYGGSSKGVMGAVCSSVKAVGGRITGVLPKKVADLNHYDPEIGMVIAQDMAERKSHFWKCDLFLCLPGAYGSMDELFEILTLTKLGYVEKRPIIIFNQFGMYDPLKQLFKNMVDHGLMGSDRADLVKFCDSPGKVLDEVCNAG